MVVTSSKRTRHRLAGVVLAGGVAAGALLGACSASDDDPRAGGTLAPLATADDTSAGDGAQPGADLVGIDGRGGPGAVRPEAGAPTTDEGAAGADEVDESTTEATAPPTTEPTTTAAPTTTVPATTTTVKPEEPVRIPVQPLGTPLQAVGTSSGPETERLQRRLLDLGFWLQRPNGSYDLTTSQAVMAFQKYLGIDATGSVDASTAALLSNLTVRPYGHADSGTLLEVDKTRQILFFVLDGRVQWIFNTSTGNGEAYEEEDQNSPGSIVKGVSLTPNGFHRVERERPEGWWEGDLGQIYRPKYFVGGVAVHGSNHVPNYPASHGCVRVTIQAMDFIWDQGLMPMTLPVWVHENARPA